MILKTMFAGYIQKIPSEKRGFHHNCVAESNDTPIAALANILLAAARHIWNPNQAA